MRNSHTTIGFTIPLTTVKLYAAVNFIPIPKSYSLNQSYEQNHFRDWFYVFQLIYVLTYKKEKLLKINYLEQVLFPI